MNNNRTFNNISLFNNIANSYEILDSIALTSSTPPVIFITGSWTIVYDDINKYIYIPEDIFTDNFGFQNKLTDDITSYRYIIFTDNSGDFIGFTLSYVKTANEWVIYTVTPNTTCTNVIPPPGITDFIYNSDVKNHYRNVTFIPNIINQYYLLEIINS